LESGSKPAALIAPHRGSGIFALNQFALDHGRYATETLPCR